MVLGAVRGGHCIGQAERQSQVRDTPPREQCRHQKPDAQPFVPEIARQQRDRGKSDEGRRPAHRQGCDPCEPGAKQASS